MPEDNLHLKMLGSQSSDTHEGTLMSGLPHSAAMGMRLISSEDGKAVLSLPWDERLIGDPETGIIGGGAITALLDTCCGAAVIATKGVLSTATLDLRIDYMRPATPGEAIIAQAQCYRVTRSVAFVRAVAYHDDIETPVATAAASFIVDRKEPKA